MNYKGMLSRGKKKRRMSGGHTSALSTIHNSYGSTNCFRFEGVISANPRREGTPLFPIFGCKCKQIISIHAISSGILSHLSREPSKKTQQRKNLKTQSLRLFQDVEVVDCSNHCHPTEVECFESCYLIKCHASQGYDFFVDNPVGRCLHQCFFAEP